MLDFYHNLNISSGIMLHDIESDKNSLSSCGAADISATIKCEKTHEVCEGCSQKIYDRYYLNVADKNWHEACLTCNICHLLLSYKCYVRNSKLYCKDDYYRIYGTKCARCCEKITPDEMVMRVQNSYVYHVNCFVCCSCNQPLQKGEQFAFRGGQLICRSDLEKESQFLPQTNTFDDDYIIEEHVRSRDGRRGPKRPRTILTSSQRRQFKASFDLSPKPCRKVREALAKDTGLSVRVVQVWFQNQRAKMKKVQRKSKDGGDKSDKEKEDKIKQESPGSDYIDNGYGQPLNPNLPFSPDDYPGNSDSICSSDISLDGSNFDHLDDASDSVSLQNLDLHSHHLQQLDHHLHLNNNNNNNSILTSLDKLYQMQSNYFIAGSVEQ